MLNYSEYKDLLKEGKMSVSETMKIDEITTYMENNLFPKFKGSVKDVIQTPALTTFKIGFKGDDDRAPYMFAHGKTRKLVEGQLMSRFNLINVVPNIRQEGNRLCISIPKPTNNRNILRLSSGLKDMDTVIKNADPNSIKVYLGIYATGSNVYIDINDNTTRSLLISGQNGSGKTVLGRAIALNLLLNYNVSECELKFIDYKNTEFASFDNIPGVLRRETDLDRMYPAAVEMMEEMKRRNELFIETGSGNITTYNNKVKESEKLPHLFLFIDEYQSIVKEAQNGKRFNDEITRLAQLGRSTGIHIIIMTQKPSASEFGTTLRSELNGRICFKVDTPTTAKMAFGVSDSGAEHLTGNGDGIIMTSSSTFARFQAPFIDEDETNALCDYLRKNRK